MKIKKSEFKQIVMEELTKILTEKDEKLQRWKVFIDGERLPFIVSGKDQRAVKKTAHAMTYPAKIRIKRIVKEGLNEDFGSASKQLPTFSSKEAKKVVDDALRMWAKDLRKSQHRIIKDWMSKAKAGVIDYFDIVRGIQTGDVSRAHHNETQFLHSLLNKDKIMNRFRSYFGGKKGLPRGKKK